MLPNDPSNPSPKPDAVYPWGFLAIFLAAAAAVAVVVLVRENEQPSPSMQLPASSDKVGETNSIPAPPVRIEPGPAEKLSQPAPETKDPAAAKLIAQLFNESLSLKVRSRAARSLAKLGTDEALAALIGALGNNSPPYLNAAIAQGFGESPNPAARDLINDLIYDKNEIIARGAVRGMALGGDGDAVNSLTGLLIDEQVPSSVRTEAALALGDLNFPDALKTLVRAAAEIKDEEVLEGVLEGLGKKPFSETENFYSSFLSSQVVSSESKVAAIEALGNAQAEVAPFLLNYLADPDADLRAAAALALNTSDNTDGIAPQLTDALKQETEPHVRARIYRALENQAGADCQAVLPLVKNETDSTARLAGLTFLAGALRSSAAPELEDFFDRTAVPELKNAALYSDSSHNRLEAVIALHRAGTPAAAGALEEIVRQSTDRKVVASAQKKF
jgi:HEAT repeat protein